MGKYVNRPDWLNERFERCAEFVIMRIDEAFKAPGPAPQLFDANSDLEQETTEYLTEIVFGHAGQGSVGEIHHTVVIGLMSDAFEFYLPSIARMALTVHDFDSHSPAENGLFDDALLDRLSDEVKHMSLSRQMAAKALSRLICRKYRHGRPYSYVEEVWRSIPDSEQWIEDCEEEASET
jgi:hypothetical protein